LDNTGLYFCRRDARIFWKKTAGFNILSIFAESAEWSDSELVVCDVEEVCGFGFLTEPFATPLLNAEDGRDGEGEGRGDGVGQRGGLGKDKFSEVVSASISVLEVSGNTKDVYSSVQQY
jgi:hypothetical protein